MGSGLMGWPTLLIILVVIVLLFGAAKLPALAKSVGQSARVFKGEMKAMREDDASEASTPSNDGTAANSTSDSSDSGTTDRPA